MLIFRDGGAMSEKDYIQQDVLERHSEARWQTQLSGKDHLVIPSEDFSVTLCARMVITKDYYDVDGWNPPHK